VSNSHTENEKEEEDKNNNKSSVYNVAKRGPGVTIIDNVRVHVRVIVVRTWRWRILLNVADVSMKAINSLLHDDIRAVAGLDEQRLFNEPYHFS